MTAENNNSAENESVSARYREQSNLFSSEALDKMRSPEKLDSALPITNPIAWMGLVAVCVLMISVVIWSVYGSFTVKAEGMGLIMDAQGVVKISSPSGGTLDKFYVAPGMKVTKGERIAHISEAREKASTRMAQYGPELASNRRDVTNKVYEFESRLYSQETMEYIRASADGTIDEITVAEGAVVSVGTTVCTMRVDAKDNNLIGVMYIPVEKGKRVQPGMTIQLSPNGVDVSETGNLLATVRSVSTYPVSMQAASKRLGNDNLAQMIFQTEQGAVMEINFELIKDETSPSGYLWTSQIGRNQRIAPGSFCKGSVIIEKKPPIEKVFYKLSQWLSNG